MKDFQKALYSRKGSQLDLSFDLQTLEGSERVVVGFATLDNVDFGDDIVASEASLKAFQNFRGNVRVQHDKARPVGRVLDFIPAQLHDPVTGQTHDGIKVAVYISEGAEDIWKMCQDGTLSGFSIGGAVTKASKVYRDDLKKTVQIIDEYALLELSLVDSPMNGLANVVDIFKALDQSNLMEKDFNTLNLFYCGTDRLAAKVHGSDYDCPSCGDAMVSFGKTNENEEISKSLEKVFAELNNKETKGGQSTVKDTTVEINKDAEGNTEEVVVEEAVIDEEAPKAEEEKVETEVEEVVETPDAETETDNAESDAVEEVAAEEEAKIDEDTKTLMEDLKAALAAAREESSATAKSVDGFKDELETLSKGFTTLKSEIEALSTEQGDIKEKLNSVNEGIQATQKRLDVVDENSVFKKSLEGNSSEHESVKEPEESIFKGRFWSGNYKV